MASVVRCPKRTCTRCGVLQSFSAFAYQGRRRKSWCRSCWNSWRRARRHAGLSSDSSPEVQRRYNLKRTYGITEEEFVSLLQSQNWCCALCGSPSPKGRGEFHVDHDHETGEIRALLCHSCNTGLGAFKDDPNLLLQASLYLVRHQANTKAAFA